MPPCHVGLLACADIPESNQQTSAQHFLHDGYCCHYTTLFYCLWYCRQFYAVIFMTTIIIYPQVALHSLARRVKWSSFLEAFFFFFFFFFFFKGPPNVAAHSTASTVQYFDAWAEAL